MAQAELVGEDQFPQFRHLGGFPGNGHLLRWGGVPGGEYGVVTLSTPTALALRGGAYAVGGSMLSRDSSFIGPNFGDIDLVEGNGTGQILVGIPIGEEYGHLSATALFLSGLGDTAFGFHWQPGDQSTQENWRWAIGVQDIVGDGGSSGEGQPGDADSSTSLYGVITYRPSERIFISGGLGTRRFQPAFASISANLAPRVTAFAEHDSFNINTGLAYTFRISPAQEETWYRYERALEGTVMIGLVRGEFAYWGLNFHF